VSMLGPSPAPHNRPWRTDLPRRPKNKLLARPAAATKDAVADRSFSLV
jgi:hypothetical protein